MSEIFGSSFKITSFSAINSAIKRSFSSFRTPLLMERRALISVIFCNINVFIRSVSSQQTRRQESLAFFHATGSARRFFSSFFFLASRALRLIFGVVLINQLPFPFPSPDITLVKQYFDVHDRRECSDIDSRVPLYLTQLVHHKVDVCDSPTSQNAVYVPTQSVLWISLTHSVNESGFVSHPAVCQRAAARCPIWGANDLFLTNKRDARVKIGGPPTRLFAERRKIAFAQPLHSQQQRVSSDRVKQPLYRFNQHQSTHCVVFWRAARPAHCARGAMKVFHSHRIPFVRAAPRESRQNTTTRAARHAFVRRRYVRWRGARFFSTDFSQNVLMRIFPSENERYFYAQSNQQTCHGRGKGAAQKICQAAYGL